MSGGEIAKQIGEGVKAAGGGADADNRKRISGVLGLGG